ncbi:hypothetical protein BpHYR1_012809 [Brachionus plicatilis]|uniref:Uncharacterized protein n=1 Tax=Brachionus plicatilis TaxID=10195 RepID=A0A3M7RYJ3_BRAPC|nr:hypothetical protein BpHYR1_012809 [Brachionus plicatilis]
MTALMARWNGKKFISLYAYKLNIQYKIKLKYAFCSSTLPFLNCFFSSTLPKGKVGLGKVEVEPRKGNVQLPKEIIDPNKDRRKAKKNSKIKISNSLTLF